MPLARFELGRILIVDFDVHHGNGTQEIFYDSSRVGFLSIHRYPFYPGTGARTRPAPATAWARFVIYRSDTGPRGPTTTPPSAPGWKTSPIASVPSWCSSAPASTPTPRTRSATWAWRSRTSSSLTKEIVDVAETHAGGRIVSVLEGGYNVSILAGCVVAHLDALGAERGRI